MNPKPKPPLPGGEHVQFIDTGPQGVSPNATRVNLIPVGDGGPGTLPPPPTFKRKKPKPLLPSLNEIQQLPRGARLAFAIRCAQRVLPIARDGAPGNSVNAGEPLSADPDVVFATATRAAHTILLAAFDPQDLTFIRRDFARLRWLAKRNGWTDETSVPPEVIGPLWSRRVPDWAKNKDKPRE